MVLPTLGATGFEEVRLGRVEWGGERKMELPPRLGLGTINTAPLMEGLIYYQSTCLEFRYEDGKVLSTQPHPTHGSASTHYVLRLNLIKGTFNFHHSRLTHTLVYI